MIYVYGFFYRLIMKIAHHYNWHYTQPCYPDGDVMLWCHWCGVRVVVKRAAEHGVQWTESGLMPVDSDSAPSAFIH